jgi:two-component system, response regulator PdtaR
MIDFPSDALILIVEDDALQRLAASDMFLDAGFRVLEAENADEALQLLETNDEIALLFTDVTLPGSMTGSHLAHLVNQQRPRVAIIAVSGLPRPDELRQSTSFHAKPYEPMAVLRQATEMTTRPRNRDVRISS